MRPQSLVSTYAFWLLLSTAILTAPTTAGGRDQRDPENSEAGQVGLGKQRAHALSTGQLLLHSSPHGIELVADTPSGGHSI